MNDLVNQIVSTAWLENALRYAGLLVKTDRILSYEVQPLALVNFQVARTFRIYLQISGTTKAPPKSIVLKFAKGQKEYYFFTQLAPQMKMKQLMICHYEELIEDGNTAVLLLEDLCETHNQPQWPLPPSQKQCEDAVRCLAAFHTYWWNHADLPQLLEISRQRTHWLQRMELALQSVDEFIFFLGDRLPPARKQILQRIISSKNRSWLPEQAPHGSTIIHGDAHFWNFLFDNAGKSANIRLFDWSSWNIGRSTDDLAYMIGLHWFGLRKQLMEEKILRFYHEQLLNGGVDYTWDALQQDYRLSTVVSLLIPVWQWQHGINAAVWWGHLERGFQAFEQWECMALFD